MRGVQNIMIFISRWCVHNIGLFIFMSTFARLLISHRDCGFWHFNYLKLSINKNVKIISFSISQLNVTVAVKFYLMFVKVSCLILTFNVVLTSYRIKYDHNTLSMLTT